MRIRARSSSAPGPTTSAPTRYRRGRAAWGLPAEEPEHPARNVGLLPLDLVPWLGWTKPTGAPRQSTRQTEGAITFSCFALAFQRDNKGQTTTETPSIQRRQRGVTVPGGLVICGR